MAPKKAPAVVVKAPPAEVAPPPPPPRDPKVPLTFDEMWFNAEDEIEDEEERNHAKELKAHIMTKAAEVRQYLEESLMVAILLQALQHMIVDRPNDPFRYLARFIRDEGPNIAAEIERAKEITARKQVARDNAKWEAMEADRLAREEAERLAREEADRLACEEAKAAAKALRDREAARLAAAARAAAEEAKKAAMLKLQQEAAMAAAVATDTIPKADKKKEPTKPAKAGPKKPEWQK